MAHSYDYTIHTTKKLIMLSIYNDGVKTHKLIYPINNRTDEEVNSFCFEKYNLIAPVDLFYPFVGDESKDIDNAGY